VSNDPRAKYNAATRADCNFHLPLWYLVRASTTAPTCFPPEVVTFGTKELKPHSFILIDRGVTAYKNPAFLVGRLSNGGRWPFGAHG